MSDPLTTAQRALWDVREAGFAEGEFVGQESFASASEIRWLARQAGIGPRTTVLDLCCGVAGPGLLLVRELGCDYLGVDASAASIGSARRRAAQAGVEVDLEVRRVPPVPRGPFDVVLLLETLLAFRERDALLAGIAAALPIGGRLALTVESGAPLTPAEQEAMPASDTVWLAPLGEVVAGLGRAGLRVVAHSDRTQAHSAVVDGLTTSYESRAEGLGSLLGEGPVAALVESHRLWGSWLRSGRVRKVALVAEKVRA